MQGTEAEGWVVGVDRYTLGGNRVYCVNCIKYSSKPGNPNNTTNKGSGINVNNTINVVSLQSDHRLRRQEIEMAGPQLQK